MIKVLHNPFCSKSNCVLELLKEEQVPFESLDYQKNPLDKEGLTTLLLHLGLTAEELIRKNETLFLEKFEGKQYSEEQWVEIMVQYPVLIQRPVLIDGDKAIIGRPPADILRFIKK